jgi:condensin complex subunit 2
VFESVISSLRRSYPKEKMDEISTSFCFICLLHLANEKGLKIDVGQGETNIEEGDNKVGDIWGLKVTFISTSFFWTR